MSEKIHEVLQLIKNINNTRSYPSDTISLLNKFASILRGDHETYYSKLFENNSTLIDNIIRELTEPTESNIKLTLLLISKAILFKSSLTGLWQVAPYDEESLMKKMIDTAFDQNEISKLYYESLITTKDLISIHKDKNDTNYVQKSNHLQEVFNNIESKVNDYEGSLEQHKNEVNKIIEKLEITIQSNYGILEKAFKEFRESKKKEIFISIFTMFLLSTAAIYTAYLGHTFGIAYNTMQSAIESSQDILSILTDSSNSTTAIKTSQIAGILKEKYTPHPAISTIGIIIIEILTIYFFRLAHHNFQSARHELLQIETRISLCKFAPIYHSMLEKNEKLSEFSRHIFSPLTTHNTPPPQPTDAITQLADSIAKTCKR